MEEEEDKREKMKFLQVSVSIEACCPDTLMVSFSDLEMMESKPFRKNVLKIVQCILYSKVSKPFSAQCKVYRVSLS